MAKLRDRIDIVRDSDGDIVAIYKTEFDVNLKEIKGKITPITDPNDDMEIREMQLVETEVPDR